jgi:hypothetical protein
MVAVFAGVLLEALVGEGLVYLGRMNSYTLGRTHIRMTPR